MPCINIRKVSKPQLTGKLDEPATNYSDQGESKQQKAKLTMWGPEAKHLAQVGWTLAMNSFSPTGLVTTQDGLNI